VPRSRIVDYAPIASNSLKMIRVTFSKPDGIFRRMFSGAHSLRDRWVECIILVAFDKQYGFWAHYNFLGQIFCWFVFLTIISKWLWKCVYWMSSSSVIQEQFAVLCVVPPESFLLFRWWLWKGIGVGASMVVPDSNSNTSIQCTDSIPAGFIFLKLSYCFHFHYRYVSPFWIAFLSGGQVLQLWTKS